MLISFGLLLPMSPKASFESLGHYGDTDHWLSFTGAGRRSDAGRSSMNHLFRINLMSAFSKPRELAQWGSGAYKL
jgi:hypothetical protein